jgi:hypothetical protein
LVEDVDTANATNNNLTEKIARALIDYNYKLERFENDYEEIAKARGITADEARQKFQHIELNKPDGNMPVQITIDAYVTVAVPYWYMDEKAIKIFREVDNYTKVVARTVGYFVYDPQARKAYDPRKQDFSDHALYLSLMNNQTGAKKSKPWWKFW